MTITLTVQINKAKNKDNINYSKSIDRNTGKVSTHNFTGKLINIEGYITPDGVDISDALIQADVATVALVGNSVIANAIIEQCRSIYATRQATGNTNPSVQLVLECNDIVIPGNILAKNITKAFIKTSAENVQTSNDILANLKKQQAENHAKRTTKNLMNNAMKAGRPVPQQSAVSRPSIGNFIRKRF